VPSAVNIVVLLRVLTEFAKEKLPIRVCVLSPEFHTGICTHLVSTESLNSQPVQLRRLSGAAWYDPKYGEYLDQILVTTFLLSLYSRVRQFPGETISGAIARGTCGKLHALLARFACLLFIVYVDYFVLGGGFWCLGALAAVL